MVLEDLLNLYGASKVAKVSIIGSVTLSGTLTNICYSFGDCIVRKLSFENNKITVIAEYPDYLEV